MSTKTKKIIAREGLVIIGIIALSIFLNFISYRFPPLPKEAHGNYLVSTEGDHHYIVPAGNATDKRSNWIDVTTIGKKKMLTFEEYKELDKKGYPPETIARTIDVTFIIRMQDKIRTLGFIILFGGYPIYLLIRFIIWAVRTLKSK